MRSPLRIAGVTALVALLGACGVITGLNDYSKGTCTEDCDASVHEAGPPGHPDSGVDGTVTTVDSGDDGGLEDGDAGTAPGCTASQLECDAGCLDPSQATSCGSCGTTCGGDASLCAADPDSGAFGCTGTCPAATPTVCNSSCVDLTSDDENCMTCGNACSTSIANASPACVSSACTFQCNPGFTQCGETCVNFSNDPANCNGCGLVCSTGETCENSACVTPSTADGGSDTGAAAIPCPDGGCPSSGGSGFVCPFGHCNGATSTCSTAGGCFCSADSQCLSQKCVKITGENDLSCGSSGCSGTGQRDGFDCELSTPGLPVPAGSTTYSCPAGSGFGGKVLTCDSTDTNCYCNADTQCPSGKCIPSATHNASCASPAGPCSGSGTADYRGCVAPTAFQSSCAAPYCGSTCSIGYCTAGFACSGQCLCTNDSQCDSGKCVKGSSNSSECGSNCTGSGTADSHSCVVPPSSVACASSGGGTSCTTTLTPAPVLNSGKTACLCVADADCSSGHCVNKNSQCTGGCSGSGSADAEDCETAVSTVTAWSCSAGNCDNVSSPSGKCTATGIPCWCTSDSSCPGGTLCSAWAGCASGQCTGSGTGNAFNCVP